ncbi:MAG: 30S ribosomal protein THX [Fluviicola sp.]|jgi:ribosomal small subunit protein bTHX
MGKGDIKTAKGKRVRGTYGNSRKRKTATAAKPAATPKAEKKSAPKAEKAAAAPKAEKKAAPKKAAAPKKTTKKTEE